MYEINNTKYTILCVDDNKNNLFTLTALLKTLENVQTIEALSADEGLTLLLKNHVDLILSDVQMPDINGFEFAKILKSNKKTKDIPIIFVTAIFKSEEFIKYGFEIGAVDYITKPIDDNQLLNKIHLYLKLFSEKEKATQNEKKLYELAQSIGDGVYTIDREEKITFINHEALRLLGFQESELLGKHAHEYIHYKDKNSKKVSSKECKIHTSMLRGEKVSDNNDAMIKKDGSILEVSLVATPLFIDGEVVGTVVTFHDKSNEKKIQRLESEKSKNQEQIIHSMVGMIESRDTYTAGHTKRVAYYCELIAKEMGYKDEEIELLKKSAWLHDIGKISTPDSVLLKPAKLNNLEYELIQDHLNAGYLLLSKIDAYKEIADIMREHHEKYDGSGYPRGLKAQEIRPLSRIMIVADSFDAMTTNRIYKAKKSVTTALQELQELSAKSYHPEVVDAACRALKDIKIDANITQLPQTSIEEQRFSYFYKDRLTDLFIIDYIDIILRDHFHAVKSYKYSINLHKFSAYNTQFTWKKGDEFLKEFAHFLKKIYPKQLIFRIEGDDFLIVSEEKLENIDTDIATFEKFKDTNVSFTVSEKS